MNGKFTLRHYVGDTAICIFLAILLTVVYVAFSGNDNGNKKVRVLQNGKEIAVYNLTDSASLYVDGVHIKVRDGRAVIFDSDCADKVCMGMPGVNKNGGGSVCIPNKIVLEPVDNNSDTDAVAG